MVQHVEVTIPHEGLSYKELEDHGAKANLLRSSHRCALLLNGSLAAFFVIMGSFNGLVTLIGESAFLTELLPGTAWKKRTL